MPSRPSTAISRRRHRLLIASCLSTATVTHVQSFSLSQNAANAAREDNSPTASDGSRSTARSRAVVIAAGSSLHSHHSTWNKRWSSKDDFALRANNVQVQLEERGDAVDDDDVNVDSTGSISKPCATNCESETTTPTSASSAALAQHQDAASVLQHRRRFLHNFVASTAAIATATAASTTSTTTSTTIDNEGHYPFTPESASAFEYTYPIELTSAPLNAQDQTPSNSLSKLQQERLTNKRSKVIATQNELSSDPLGLSSFTSPHEGILLVTGVSLWTLALWFISGSRSNPFVNPIANVLYDVNDDSDTIDWLRNRNDGYFSEYPPQLTIVLTILFLTFGIIADRSVYFLADGEATIPVELGGVAAISGAFWEVGRIAAGEKSATKEESDRESLIEGEFEEFASKRLQTGRSSLSVHRSEVVKAFRRYNPKYRVENDEYPLSDVEIERVARAWARKRGIDMSGAGFFGGLGIDSDADAFAPR